MSHTDEQFFLENLVKINRIVEKVLVIFCAVPVIFILFTIIGLWNVSHIYSVILLFTSLVSSIVLHYINTHNKHQTFGMYFGIFSTAFIFAFMNYTNTIRLYISFAIVPIISLLYYNKRLTMITCIANYIL